MPSVNPTTTATGPIKSQQGTTAFNVGAADSRRKVLVVLSSEDHLTLQSGKDQETGFFLPELVKPVIKLIDAGFTPVFANPKGNPPAVDPLSTSLPVFLFNWLERNREQAKVAELKQSAGLNAPLRLADVSDDLLEREFLAVLIPGGHAPMQDLWDDREVGRILSHFHSKGKPTAALCHGPIALLSTRTVGPFPYAGYKLSCYSDREESLNEKVFGSPLKFKVEEELNKAGATVVVNPIPMGTKVIVDRELVTAQGFTSADSFGETFVETVKKFVSNGAQSLSGSVPSQGVSAPSNVPVNQTTESAKVAGIAGQV